MYLSLEHRNFKKFNSGVQTDFAIPLKKSGEKSIGTAAARAGAFDFRRSERQRLFLSPNSCRFCVGDADRARVMATLSLVFFRITVIMRRLRGDVFSMTLERLAEDSKRRYIRSFIVLAVGTSFHPNENDQTRCPQVLKTPRR